MNLLFLNNFFFAYYTRYNKRKALISLPKVALLINIKNSSVVVEITLKKLGIYV